MEETTFERALLDRVVGVVSANRRFRTRALVLDIERSIEMVFEGWEPPRPAHRDIYRDLCFAAGEGRDRDWMLGHFRDDQCTGLFA
jgi:hypothetical protein